jgi:two-component sensor histidine kinase
MLTKPLLGVTFLEDESVSKAMSVSKVEHDRIVKECLTQVNHRANNLLSVIHGIIRMSSGTTIDAFKQTIEGRISALAQAHSLLSASNWESIPLYDLIRAELMNHIDPSSSRIHLSGVSLMLPGPRAQNAAMIMHELVSNAVKHGALKTKRGEITVKWEPMDDGLHYCWYEDGVVDCKEPDELGTGLTFVHRLVRSTRATMEISWLSTGVHIDFVQPYDHTRTRESVMAA